MTEAVQMASAQAANRLQRRRKSTAVAFWERPGHEEKQQRHCVSPVRLYLLTIRRVGPCDSGLGNGTPLFTSQ